MHFQEQKKKKKEQHCFMCVFFLWQSNELLIFPLLGVSTIPLEFHTAVLSLCTGGLFLFFIFIFFVFISSPLDISFMLFIFLYSVDTVAFFTPSLFLPLWRCTLYILTHFLSVLCCLCFRHGFLFLPQYSPPLPYYTPYNGAVFPAIFFTSCILFKSPLSSPYLPLLLLLLATTPLKSFHSLFTSIPFPPPSLAASNMLYSLSCFPECEECCCFRMSPA